MRERERQPHDSLPSVVFVAGIAAGAAACRRGRKKVLASLAQDHREDGPTLLLGHIGIGRVQRAVCSRDLCVGGGGVG